MEKSKRDINAWMEAIKLKLNKAKTKFIYFGSRQQLNKTTHDTINIIGESIERSTKVKYLGGHLDSNLTFREHILIKCKAALLNIIKIQNIRKSLNKGNVPQMYTTAGYIIFGLCKLSASRTTSSSIKIMQKMQNTATRLILGKNAKENSTECLKPCTGYQYNKG